VIEPGRPFLDLIGERAAGALVHGAVIRRWPAGAVLFHEGDRSDRVLIVRSGRIKLTVTAANGTETVLAIRGEGELVGELSAIDGEPRVAAAVALGDVACAVVEVDRFVEVLQGEPDVALVLLRVLTARLREAEGRRTEAASLDTVQRLARRLSELADSDGVATDGGVVVRGLNQEELGALVGASRESVSKALQALRNEGLVRTARRSVVVTDRQGLRRRGGTA